MRDPAPYRAGDTPHQSSALEIGWTCWMRATGMVVNTGHLRGCLAYRGWLRTPDVGCTLVLHLSDLDARQRSANGSGEVVMASSIGPALVGLGGVIIGGGMTMVTVWWQTLSSRKSRLAELELEFRHQRLLRDEAARRSALLELLYIIRRLNNCVYEIGMEHRTLFKTLEKCDDAGSRVATIGNGSPERIESSVEGILVSRRTVALPSYYRPGVVADAGTRVPGSGGTY